MFTQLLQTLSPLPKRVSKPPIRLSPSQEVSTKRKPKSVKKSAACDDKSKASTRRGPSQSAVKSKIKATQRVEKIQIKPTQGGEVLTLQGGTYEVFKKVLCTMYQARQQTLCGRSIVFGTPREDPLAHSTSIPVQSNGAQYTLNLYHTTCRILANGKSPEQFYQDFKDIVFYIRSEQRSGNIPLDDQVKYVLKQYLDDQLQSTEDPTGASDLSATPEVQAEGSVLTRTTRRSNRNKTAPEQSTVRGRGSCSNSNSRSLKGTEILAIQSNSQENQQNNDIVIEDLANVISKDNPIQDSHANDGNLDMFQDALDNTTPDPEIPVSLPSHATKQGPLVPNTQPAKQPTPTSPPPPPMQERIPMSRESHIGPPMAITGATGEAVDVNEQQENGTQVDHSRGSAQTENNTQPNSNPTPVDPSKKNEEDMTKEELLAHMRKRESALQKREENIKLQSLKLENAQRDLANSRAQIAMLEDRVRELERDKRDLNQKLLLHSSNPNASNNPPPVHTTHTQPSPTHHIAAQPSNSDILHQMQMMQIQSKHAQELLQARHSQDLQEMRHSQEIQQIRFQNTIERLTPAQQYVSSPPAVNLIHPYQGLQAMNYGALYGGPAPYCGLPYMQQSMAQNAHPARKPPFNTFIPNPPRQPTRQQGHQEAPAKKQKNGSSNAPSSPDEATAAARSQSTAATSSPDTPSNTRSTDNGGNNTPEAEKESRSEPKDAFLAQAHRTNHEGMVGSPQ